MAKGKTGGLFRRGIRRVRSAGRKLVRQPAPTPTGPAEVCFVSPDGRQDRVEVEANTTVLAAARRLGLDLDHYCGGQASCGTCRVVVAAHPEGLAVASGREQMVLGYERTQAGDRLACQARVIGPVSLEIPRRF